MRLLYGYVEIDDLDAFLDSLSAIGAEHDCVVQAFDAGLVAGERHLERALSCARRASTRGEAIARDPAVEVLCYAAGRRQIDDALELGVGGGREPVVVLVAASWAAEERGGESDVGASEAAEASEGVDASEVATTSETVTASEIADEEAAAADVADLIDLASLEHGTELGDPERLRSYFEIGDAECAATSADLETLVCERVALLAVER